MTDSSSSTVPSFEQPDEHPPAVLLTASEEATVSKALASVWASDAECLAWQAVRATPELLRDIEQQAQESEMMLQNRLRKRYPAELVRVAITVVQLRRLAGKKFSRASELWLDRTNFEQSTAEAISIHKSRRFQGAVIDACTGMGSDAIALARQPRVTNVTAVDVSPVALLRASWNAAAYGALSKLSLQQADVTSWDFANQLVHMDPDRRPGSTGRVSRIEDYQPGLEFLENLTRQARGGAIKLSPASNFTGRFAGCELELVSLHGECKEATVWFGELASGHERRATVLPSGQTLAGDPLGVLAETTPLQRFLYDPDPAVVRAGMVDQCAVQLGLSRLDAAEEYLTGEASVESPFVQRFEVLDELPNNETQLRQAVRQRGWGPVEIKCRHVPIQADTIRRKLKCDGREPGVVVFARIQGKTRIVLARRVLEKA